MDKICNTSSVRMLRATERPYNVLFIGNSATYVNNLPSLFVKICTASGYSVRATSTTKGGAYLAEHVDEESKLHAELSILLRENKYDFVILQEHGKAVRNHDEQFFESTRILTETVRQAGAVPVIYGRAPGKDPVKNEDGTETPITEVTSRMKEAFQKAASELDIELVAYACDVICDLESVHGNEIEAFAIDRSHLSYTGTAAIALTLYAEMTGEDPLSVNDCNINVTPSEWETVKRVAHERIYEGRA